MKTLLRILLILSLLITGLFISPSQAAHAEEPAFSVPPKQPAVGTTAYKTLTGLDFHPETNSTAFTSIMGGIYPTSNVAGFGFNAPLNLPSGAQVTEITVFFVDNSDASNLLLSIRGYNPDTDSYDYKLDDDTSSSPSSAAIQSKTYSGSPLFTVDNSKAAYRMRVEFTAVNGAQVLYGARIQYTMPAAPTGDDYITIAGADFRTTSSNMTYKNAGEHLYATRLDPPHVFTARVDLPQGAQIQQVEFFVVDNTDGADQALSLIIRDPFTTTFLSKDTSTFGLSSTTNVRKVTLTLFPPVPVDNTLNSYYLQVLPDIASTDEQIVAARVRFTPSTTLQTSWVKSYAGIHFFPTGSGLTFRANGGSLYPLAVSAGQSFEADMDLPEGMIVKKVTFYVIDNHLGANLSLAARIYTPETGQVVSPDPVSGSTTALAASPDIREVSFTEVPGVIDTQNHTFNLLVEPGAAGADLMLAGARVEYTYPGMMYLPMVGK